MLEQKKLAHTARSRPDTSGASQPPAPSHTPLQTGHGNLGDLTPVHILQLQGRVGNSLVASQLSGRVSVRRRKDFGQPVQRMDPPRSSTITLSLTLADLIEVAKWQYLESLLDNPAKLVPFILFTDLGIRVEVGNDNLAFTRVFSAVREAAGHRISAIKAELRTDAHRLGLQQWLGTSGGKAAVSKPMGALKLGFTNPVKEALFSSASALRWLLDPRNAHMESRVQTSLKAKLRLLEREAEEEEKKPQPVLADPRSVEELLKEIGEVKSAPTPERKKKPKGRKRKPKTKKPATAPAPEMKAESESEDEPEAKPLVLVSDPLAESIVLDRPPRLEEAEGKPWMRVGAGGAIKREPKERTPPGPLEGPAPESPELRTFVLSLRSAVAETAGEIEELEDRAFATLKLYPDEGKQKALINSIMPPIEVHNHLTGILTVEDLVRMKYRGDYKEAAKKLFIVYRGSAEIGDTPKNIEVFKELERQREGAAVQQLHSVLTANEAIQFETAYAPRGKLMSFISADLSPVILWRGILIRLKGNDIKYAEIRVSDEGFPDALYGISRRDFDGLCAELGIRIAFLPSASSYQNLTRGFPVKERKGLRTALFASHEFVDLVAGVDVGGPEDEIFKFGEREFISLFDMVTDAAKRRGVPLVVSPHVGEGHVMPASSSSSSKGSFSHAEVASENIRIILSALKKLKYKQGESNVVVRLGHVTHIDYPGAQEMGSAGIFAEVNISSNLMTRSIETLQEHPLLLLLFHQVPTLLSTDGQGVVNTSLLREFRLADAMIQLFKQGRINMKWVEGWISYDALCKKHSKDEVDRLLSLEPLVESAKRYLRLMNIKEL